ncbi:ATPase associated with various cellular activities AAA_3 protein [Rutstroemia sp. NJR-2017a WRK4]|nr:ATPase associated with various cellular activities AAA_3 protein [Rutstroemia sp. NJR-2017a WRK4]
MADEALLNKIHELSDLELAALICLIAEEHCIIDTVSEALDDLVQELELVGPCLLIHMMAGANDIKVASKVFGLTYAVIDCNVDTTLDDFAHAILSVDAVPTRSNSPVRTRNDSYFLQMPSFQSMNRSSVAETFENKRIANVIIAKNLDEAPKQVQIQALELMRTKRIFTRTSVQSAPKRFLFIAALAGSEGRRLTKHLNDFMFISHVHDPEDGFPNIDDMYGDDTASTSSVVKRSPTLLPEDDLWARITVTDIERLAQQSHEATVTVELKQYQQNIASFLRIHRAVGGGISATATKHFDKLVKCLAPLHGLEYATPSLIALAARKIYLHRIEIVEPERERSLQWGSDLNAIQELLDGVGPEDVIEDVLGSSGVEPPL